MGFKNPMDINSVKHQIYMSGVELCSPYNDGFTAWKIKQDLYYLKWLIDDIMRHSPTFTDEDEFVKDHEKRIVFRELQR